MKLSTLHELFLKFICYCLFEHRAKKGSYVVFNSFRNNTFSFNSKYLFLYMLDQGEEVYFIVNDDTLRNKLSKKYGNYFITTKSYKDLRLIYLARCWCTSTGLPIRIPLANKGRFIVNLWHGIPLKKIGQDDHNLSLIRWFLIKFVYRDIYDVISVTSKHYAEFISSSLNNSEKRTAVLGQPQNDLQTGSFPSLLRKGFPRLDLDQTKKNILYAPTYRDYGQTVLFPFADRDLEQIRDFCSSNNVRIYLALHHLEPDNHDLLGLEGLVTRIRSEPDFQIVENLDQFDLMITDYSSLMFDYLLFDRPMMFLPYDLEEYTQKRGLYFDYSKTVPGPIVESQDEFLSLLQSCIDQPGTFSEHRRAISHDFHQFKGSSCESTAHKIQGFLSNHH